MPAAGVRTYERNYAARVQGENSVYNAIIIPAKKGPVMTPTLVSGEKELLEKFTPRNTIEVGYNMAYYSALTALQKTDKLWVIRVVNNAEMGGVEFYDETHPRATVQVNEISPELPEISFNVSGITDGGTEITVSNLQGGVEADLVGRVINIDGVSGSYTVASVAGSTVTLQDPITSDVSFTGTGTGSIPASVDYVGFDVDFGAGGTDTVDISNLTSGVPGDLVNAQINLIADGTRLSRTVISVSGATLTLDSTLPSVTNSVGTGFKGMPEVTVDVSGIVDGGQEVTVSNITPNYIVEADLDGKTLNVTADMSDGSTLVVSSVINLVSGSIFNFVDGFNNPSLVDNSTGKAPFTPAQADGFEDPETITQTDSLFMLSPADVGEWSKDLRIEIRTNPSEVRVDDAFMILVFDKNNTSKAKEIWTVSRKEGKKDGYGRNIYIDDILENSLYIRGFNNKLVDENIMPQETVVRDSEGKIIERNFVKFVAGSDGDAVTDSNMIAAVDLMNNKNNYPVTIFLDGGWTSPAYQRKLAEVSEIRDDSVAVLSVPYDVESSTDFANAIVNYRNVELNLNSSYAALYSCHVNITDKYNDRNIFISPDGFAAAAINFSKAKYEIWYPPAGFNRGRIFVNDTLRKFTDGELDLLSDNNINPIRFAPGKGVSIWGQYTLTTSAQSTDRLNIRLLLNEIKPAITEYLEKFLFELNTKGVRDMIRVTIENYLSGIQSRNGIYSYKVVCNDTNNSDTDVDNHVVNVDVFIKPTQSIEYINFTTVLSSTGIEFENIG